MPSALPRLTWARAPCAASPGLQQYRPGRFPWLPGTVEGQQSLAEVSTAAATSHFRFLLLCATAAGALCLLRPRLRNAMLGSAWDRAPRAHGVLGVATSMSAALRRHSKPEPSFAPVPLEQSGEEEEEVDVIRFGDDSDVDDSAGGERGRVGRHGSSGPAAGRSSHGPGGPHPPAQHTHR